MSPETVRRRFVAGNWKMHLVRWEADALCRKIRAGMEANPGRIVDVAVFPSYPLIATAIDALAASGLGIGAQDVHSEAKGAFTGDVSAAQLVDAGVSFVLCGHSERRQLHGESDELVADKARTAAGAGIAPVVCVGETGRERAAGRTLEVLDRQLEPLEPLPGLVLAYEPVWAIGTGETATPEIAREAHAHLRERWRHRFGDAAATLRILYGGSVTPANAASLAAVDEIDGALVGGASLDPARFLDIISSFAATGSTPAARGLP